MRTQINMNRVNSFVEIPHFEQTVEDFADSFDSKYQYMYLDELVNFKTLNDKRKTVNYKLPMELMDDEVIDLDRWKNIPYVLLESVKGWKHGIENTSRLLDLIFSELQSRCKIVQNQFYTADRKTESYHKNLEKQMNSQNRDIKSILYDVQKTLKRTIEDQVEEMATIRAKIRKEREYFEYKIKNFECPEQIHNFIVTSIADSAEEVEKRTDEKLEKLQEQIRVIIEDNLTVKGVIGPNCRHSNLKSYILHQKKVNEAHDSTDNDLSSKCNANMNVMRTKILRIKEDFTQNLQLNQEQLKAEFHGLRQELSNQECHGNDQI